MEENYRKREASLISNSSSFPPNIVPVVYHGPKNDAHKNKKMKIEEENDSSLLSQLKQFISNKTLDIPQEKVKEFTKKYGIKKFARSLSVLIEKENLPFPYKKNYIENIEKKFENLVNYDYHSRIKYDTSYTIPVLNLKTDAFKDFRFRGKFTILTSTTNEYEEINILSDYFQEDVRVRSLAGYNQPSVMDCWKESKLNFDWLIKLIEKQKPINTFELREQLYESVKSEPSTFKATVAKFFIQMFEGKKILDFCAGWGDRLIGALSCQDSLDYYDGVDPNMLLHPNYSKIIETFAKNENKNKFQMYISPFEKWSIPHNRTYNLILGGPPYYDYEKYGENDEGQSIRSFPKIEQWVVYFLFFSIEKCWRILEEGGFMILNVNDVKQLVKKNITYAEALNLFILYKFLDAVYEGVIAFEGANMKLPRPNFIFRKDSSVKSSNEQRSKKMEIQLQTYYPTYYKEMKRWEKETKSN